MDIRTIKMYPTKWCPIWTIQPVELCAKIKEQNSDAPSPNIEKHISSLRVQVLCALKNYWQEKSANGQDNGCVREWEHVGPKNITVVLKEAHHFNVCNKISAEEMIEFLS